MKLTIRRGRIAADDVLFAGVGGVMTPAAYKRKGFSSTLVRIAQEFIFTEVDADYGLLFCLPELTPFYRRLGWISVNAPVHIEQPQGKIVWPKAAMVLPGRGRVWQDAEIDVRGNPW